MLVSVHICMHLGCEQADVPIHNHLTYTHRRAHTITEARIG